MEEKFTRTIKTNRPTIPNEISEFRRTTKGMLNKPKPNKPNKLPVSLYVTVIMSYQS